MTGAFVSRRRAEEFDALLSAPVTTRDDATATRYSDLLEVVGALRSVPEVSARPEFVADLRSRLVVEAARIARPVDDVVRARLTPQQRHGARERRAATLLGGFAIVAASGSMAMASQAALPGDVLYPMKRALENAETNLQTDVAAKAETLREHADQRLREVQQLSTEGSDAATVATTLHDFTSQSNQSAELAFDDYETTGDPTQINEQRAFSERSMDELTALADVVPEDARAALITAAQAVRQVDSAAFHLCPTCGEGGVTELPEFATASLTGDWILLNLEGTQDSVLVAPDYLERLEKMARETPDGTLRPGKGGERPGGAGDTGKEAPTGTEPPTTGVDPHPAADAKDLHDLGDRIKRDLSDDGSVSVDLDRAVGDVVGGIDGLVDTIVTTD